MKKILVSFIIVLCLVFPLMAGPTSVHNRQLSDTPSLATVNGLIAAATSSISVNSTVSVLASEDLTAGQVVSLINNQNGTVSAVHTNLAVNTSPNGAESVFSSSNATQWISSVALDSTRFLVTYQKSSDEKGYAIVGTISGSSISWGSESSAFEATSAYYTVATKISTDKVLVCYTNYSEALGRALVLSISGSTITVNTPMSYVTGSRVNASPSICTLDTDKALVCYAKSSDGKGYSIVLSVSGTTPSAGTEATFNAAATTYISCSALSSTSVICAYRDGGNSNYGVAQVLSISGTTITPGTEYVFKSAAVTYTYLAALDASKAVIVCEATNVGNVLVATDTGGALSYGTAATFTDSEFGSIAKIDATHAIIASQNGASEYGKSMIATINGTGVSLGTAYDYSGAASYYNTVCYLGNNNSVIAFRDGGDSGYGHAVVNTWITSDYSAVRGLCTTTTSSGNSAPILLSGEATGLSSLVTGSQYWLQSDFTMGTAPVSLAIMKNSSLQTGEIFIGVAKSPTTLWFCPDYK